MTIMKKIYLILAATTILGFVASCNKAEIKELNKADEVSITDASIKVDISVSSLETDTKAVKQEWTVYDLINVWLDDTPEDYDGKKSGPDFILEYKGNGEWAEKNNQLLGLTARLKESGGKIRGFYESANNFTGGTWGTSKNWANFPREGDLIKTPVVAYFNSISYSYNSKNKVFAAKIDNWTFGTDFQLVVTGISIDDGYSLICDDISTMSGIRVVNGGNRSISMGEATSKNARISGVPNADGVAFVGRVSNGDKKQRTFTLIKKGEESKRYVFKTASGVEWNSNNGKRLVANKVSIDKFRAAVDLGLTSGTLWADCNVGTDDALVIRGNYFAWGDTRVKDSYNKESHFYYSDGKYTKYRNTNTVVNDKDDVATQSWGVAWGIPSKAQWQELIDECDWTWDSERVYTEIGPIGGWNGYRVTGKNGASIFLMAAGHQDDQAPKGTGTSGVNTSGWYWTNVNYIPGSGVSSANIYANCVFFDSNSHRLVEGTDATKVPIYLGCSVRPVLKQ